jgi:predicted Zn-dependent protease
VSELAGVLAHEIGHVVLRHVAENYNRQRTTQLGFEAASVLASVLVGGHAAAAGQALGQLAVVAYLNQFSREDEQEADAFALEILPRAGYDPNGLLTFFETLQARSEGAEDWVFVSSHPTTATRIEAAAASISAAPLPGDLQVSDRGRLQIIQRRIELLGQERG